jgi:hypothetical protein
MEQREIDFTDEGDNHTHDIRITNDCDYSVTAVTGTTCRESGLPKQLRLEDQGQRHEHARGGRFFTASTGVAVAALLALAVAGAPAAAGQAGDAPNVAGSAAREESATNGVPPIKQLGREPDRGKSGNTPSPRGARSSFLAQECCDGGNGWAPGDPSIAVGREHIVEVVNSSLTVYAKNPKSPAEVFHADLTSFFGGSPIACIDPRVIYWRWSDRYAVVCSDIGSSPNVVRFAVSSGSDPSQGWNKYVVPTNAFIDQPKVEATSDKLIVAGNYGDFEEFYVYQLEDVIAGAPDPAMVHITSQAGYYQAAVQYTPASPGYFVSACAGCALRLATISGTPRTSVSLTETSLGDSRLRSTSDPLVPGGSLGGGDVDTRVLTATYDVVKPHDQPVIDFSANTGCTFAVDTVCTAVGRIVFSRSTPVLGYVEEEGSPGAAYTYGAVTVDRHGNVYLSYSRSSPTSTPSAAVLGLRGHNRRSFDALVQPSADGTSACDASQLPPCDERWGDYLGAAQDGADPASVWLVGLYQARSGVFGWATVISRARVGGVR